MKLYRIGTHKRTLIFSKNNKNEGIYPNKEELMHDIGFLYINIDIKFTSFFIIVFSTR